MTRSARQTALGALVALVGCSVYDTSLLTGVVGGADVVGGAGGSGPSSGGSGVVSGRGGTTGGSGGHGSSGGSAATGGSAASGGAGGASGGAGGSSARGGTGATGGAVSSGGTGTGGEPSGGTGNVDASGGMGEDGGAPNPADGGTTGGGSGGSGSGGSAGAGASGGSAGGGTAGSAGSPPVTAAGCAKLSASLTASTDKTHYLITLGSADVDFTNAVVKVHLYAEGADGGVFIYVQQATYEFYGMPPVPFSTFSGWTTLTWDLSATASTGTVNKAKVRRLGLEIGAWGGTTFTNPTVVYVDSISVTTPARSFSFDAASTVNTTPTAAHAGDTALWQNSASADTTASGSTLEWVASCP